MNSPLIEVKNLKQYFDTGGVFHHGFLKAVDDVSFSIAKGETLGLVGESGCGKSTLGRTVLRLNRPTAGSVIFDGTEVTDHNIAVYRRQMQMVFQDPYSALDPRLTVAETIEEPMEIQHLYTNRKERTEKIHELMNMVGIRPEYDGRYPQECSGGRRQRIGIARALAVTPRFLVCDEPVSALDVSIQAQIINMLEDLQSKTGISYLFIAHDLLVVRHISTRIAVMYLGHIVESGSADDIIMHPVHPYTKVLISSIPVPDPDHRTDTHSVRLKGEIPSPMHMPAGCPFSSRCPYADDTCKTEKPVMKDFGSGHSAACFKI